VSSEHFRNRWSRAIRSTLILEQVNTPAAVALIEKMATGHPDAAPTLTAKASLKRLATPRQKPDYEELWRSLFGYEDDAVRSLMTLYRNPAESVALLQRKCRPLTLSAERCRELFKDLGSKDGKTWKAAWEEFEYFDPRLAFDLPKLFDEVPDGSARTRLAAFLVHSSPNEFLGMSVQLEASGDGFQLVLPRYSYRVEHRIDELPTNREVDRLKAALVLLARIGTPEAAKVLEQMTGGHKDAISTREAKYLLTQLKKK
jgi:hypothetical protein